MTTESVNWAHLADTLETLRQEVARLGERVASLERTASPVSTTSAPAPVRPVASPPPPALEGLNEELILVMGAAIAAFLGKKAHIRQIRLLSSPAWGQWGRVTIQASHTRSQHHP